MARRRRRSYFTGLVTDLHDLRGQPRTIAGAGWNVSFNETAATKTYHEGREVVLSAPSWVAAQRALDLIRAGLTVIRSEPMPFDADEQLIAWNEEEPEVKDREAFDAQRTHGLRINSVPMACLLAARASTRREWHYAVIKYRFSVRLYGAYVVDLDPFRSRRHLQLSRFAEDHVTFAHAILAAYSAIEDLGLELRASRGTPSRINNGREWNPVVKKELEDRLSAAGVALTEPVLWTIRGSGTTVHKRRPVPVISPARWAGGLMVRDSHVALVDAIAQADWFRDKIAAHGVQRLTPSLSPYDVVNVQHVARRLIMEALGLWRRWQGASRRQPRAGRPRHSS